MNNRIWSKNLSAYAGQRVKVAGFLHRFRKLGSVSFLILRDARGAVQIVLTNQKQIDEISNLYNESVLEVVADVVLNSHANAGIELQNPEISVIAKSEFPPVVDLFKPEVEANLSTILDNAALTLRHPVCNSIFRISAASLEGFRSILKSADFTEITVPGIVGGASESGANVFKMDYFEKEAFLAQSPQMYK